VGLLISFEEHVLPAIYFVIGVAAVLVIVKVIDVVLSRSISRMVQRQPQFKTTYVYLKRLIMLVVALIGVYVVASVVYPQVSAAITSILIAAGFASIVVGLAAQTSLSNMIAGLMIAMTRPIRVGDAVLFRGEFGFVEDITLTYTIIRTWDNRRLIVPNSVVQSEVITNYTIIDPMKLVPIYVDISYESDIDKAKEIMIEVARNHPDFYPLEGLPQVVVMEFKDSGIGLRLLTAAKDQPTAFMMARDILYQVKKKFAENGIEIPYPRRYIVFEPRFLELMSKVASGEKR